MKAIRSGDLPKKQNTCEIDVPRNLILVTDDSSSEHIITPHRQLHVQYKCRVFRSIYTLSLLNWLFGKILSSKLKDSRTPANRLLKQGPQCQHSQPLKLNHTNAFADSTMQEPKGYSVTAV